MNKKDFVGSRVLKSAKNKTSKSFKKIITRLIPLKWKTQWAINLLRGIEYSMKKSGWPRQRRRAFWRDFSRSVELQKEVFDKFLSNK